MSQNIKDWIGVDLDGTLAQYEKFQGISHIGEPIPEMVERVKSWLAEGKTVKIFTARVAPIQDPKTDKETREHIYAQDYIEQWCQYNIGQVLPVTYMKDKYMVELWDDRCVQVQKNTGKPVLSDADSLKYAKEMLDRYDECVYELNNRRDNIFEDLVTQSESSSAYWRNKTDKFNLFDKLSKLIELKVESELNNTNFAEDFHECTNKIHPLEAELLKNTCTYLGWFNTIYYEPNNSVQ